MRLALPITLAVLLAACGQAGPLVLPDEPAAVSPVTAPLPPAAPAPAQNPAQADDSAKSRKTP